MDNDIKPTQSLKVRLLATEFAFAKLRPPKSHRVNDIWYDVWFKKDIIDAPEKEQSKK